MDYLYGIAAVLIGCALGIGIAWLIGRFDLLSRRSARTEIIGGMLTSRNFLHWDIEAGPNETIQVFLDSQANVYLVDEANWNKYERGEAFQYCIGGWATVSPVKMTPPDQAVWHVIVDLGGDPGRVRASTTVITRKEANAG